MYQLTRAIRFCINPEPWETSAAQPRHNTFAGWPAMRGLGRFYELQVQCVGEPDETIGYIVNVAQIDAVVRQQALPIIARQIETDASINPAMLMPQLLRAIQSNAHFEVRALTWRLTPYHWMTMTHDTPDELRISSEFDFAASHRLDCDSLSAEENRHLFGKCNNPNGHGHNYRVRPVVAIPASAADGGFGLHDLERIVHEQILDRFDHKHFNLDVPQFAHLNPSVEHITRVCFDLLAPAVQSQGGRLVEVTVWETDKTSCTYTAPADVPAGQGAGPG